MTSQSFLLLLLSSFNSFIVFLIILAKLGILAESVSVDLASNGLELKNVKLSALLRIIDPLDQPVVPLLERIHLIGALLLKNGCCHLILSHLTLNWQLLLLFPYSLTDVSRGLGLLLLSQGLFFLVLLLYLQSFEKLLLVHDLLGFATFNRVLLVLLHGDRQTQVVVQLLLGLLNVGTVRWQNL